VQEPTIDRDEVLVVDGVDVGSYRRRDQPPTAEFFEPSVPAAQAAQALVTSLRGWSITSTDNALVAAVVARGGTVTRRYALMTAPLDGLPTRRPVWPLELEAVRLTARTPVTDDIIGLIRTAYPPGHPDEEVGTEADIRRDVGRILSGEWLGDLLPFSRVLYDGSRPVGMAIVNRTPGQAPAGGLWLSEICRAPDRRYAGLGTQLLISVIEDCRDAGEQAMSLAVTEGNPARGVYERLGFSVSLSITKLRLPD
jgi:GNAT superfamily N-acetyltransferase